ncbi:hypothetical protein HYT02_02465 [Candidatus Gottesmanbacteria bacterium]|nr:hypothetical protein [Candidatus Gottesmanbacteria bacterium]
MSMPTNYLDKWPTSEENVPNMKNRKKDNKKTDKAWRDIMKLSGSIKGEPKDFSSNISKYTAQMYREKF